MTDSLVLGLASLVALPGLGAFAWAIRQGGRIDGHDKEFVRLEKQRTEDLEAGTKRHGELMVQIAYIRQRVDTISNDRGS
jgi:hypothetical protein